MKCISLWQPWATLIAIGAKRIETRSWDAKYTGPLAIHASKKWSGELNAIACSQPFYKHLKTAGFTGGNANRCGLPFGAIVAVCNLKASVQIEKGGKIAEVPEWISIPPDGDEYAFGDYTPGRFAWILGDIRLIKPIPVIGRQGFFDVPKASIVEGGLQ